MFNFLIKQVSASGFGMEYAPQSNALGGGSSMPMLWPTIAVIVVAGLAILIAYKAFFE